MHEHDACPAGIEAYWEDADLAPIDQDAYERELEFHVDALANLSRQIEQAVVLDRADALAHAERLYRDELDTVRRLRQAMRQRRNA
jgi:hypothetical protein